MLAGETSDIRRLFYSRFALGEDGSPGIDNSIGTSGGNLPW